MEDKDRHEIETILIGLMNSLGIPKIRIITMVALIRACKIHWDLISWVATYRGKEDTMTAQIFMSKVNELIDPYIVSE